MTTRLMEFREEWSGDDLIGRSEARVLAPADVVGNEDCSYDSHATGSRKKGGRWSIRSYQEGHRTFMGHV